MESEVFQRLADFEGSHWWFRARRRILEDLIRRNIPDSGNLRILEAGCGTGGNLSMLAPFGKVSAFELDAEACRIASLKGFCVKQGRLPESHPFANERFDLIVLFDVLEHVEEDEASLFALRKLLSPGGLMIVTVPAFPFLWSSHDVLHHHYRRYRRRDLRKQLEAAGFKVRLLSYYNFWLFPAVCLMRLLKKIKGSRTSDESSVPPAIVNALLENIFASERFLLRILRFPFGVSLVAVVE